MAFQAEKVREWALRFHRFEKSNSSIQDFCKKENVSVVSFYQWRKRLQSLSEENNSSLQPLNALARTASSPVDETRSTDLDLAMELRIEVNGFIIECRSKSMEAFSELLRWVASSASNSFQKIVVRQ